MAEFPGMTLWTDAWIADTKHLSRCERGTYHDLLVLMWRSAGCRVPNDNEWLAKHLGMTLAEVVAELRPLLAEFCQTDGNYLYQKRQRREYVRRFELGAAQSARAKHPRKKKKNPSPELAENHDPAKPGPAKPPYSTLPPEVERPFTTAATTVDNSESVAASQQEETDRSLASALPAGALTRDPDSEQAEAKQAVAEKKPVDLSLAEINERWRGNGHANGYTGFRRP